MKPTAVLVDMDGTLCDISAIRHHVVAPAGQTDFVKDFDAFHQASGDCPPHQQALDYCQRNYDAGHVIVVVTARMEKHYDVSMRWLRKYMPVPFDGPIMRQDNMRYADSEVKRNIHKYLSRNYRIVGACDDNPAIIALWEEFGIPVEIVPGWLEDHPKVTSPQV